MTTPDNQEREWGKAVRNADGSPFLPNTLGSAESAYTAMLRGYIAAQRRAMRAELKVVSLSYALALAGLWLLYLLLP